MVSAAALRGRGADRKAAHLIFQRPLANMTLRSVPDASAPKRNEYQNRRGHGGPLLIIIIISRSSAVDPEFRNSLLLYLSRGRLAQLVRATRLHRVGQGFESLGAHH